MDNPQPIDTYSYALDLLEQAVATRGPDYVYEIVDVNLGCVYFQDGVPRCLIGVVLQLAGYSDKFLSNLPQTKPILSLVEMGFLPSISVKCAGLLRVAQAIQDQHQSWGGALSAAYHAILVEFGYA